ncbi:hypothetical protein AAHB37_14230 [Glutamicibacter halophytocola]|uniref:hypothetical protein n=1 Tax=Glutamicibacter halophytocola TaxID=1933880 RepID=UPI00321BBA3B
MASTLLQRPGRPGAVTGPPLHTPSRGFARAKVRREPAIIVRAACQVGSWKHEGPEEERRRAERRALSDGEGQRGAVAGGRVCAGHRHGTGGQAEDTAAAACRGRSVGGGQFGAR